MRILFVTEFFPTGKDLRFSGGVEARTYFVAKELAKRHEVSVIASRTKNTKPFEKLNSISVYRPGEKRNYSASVGHLVSRLKFIKSAIDLGNTFDIDIVDGGNYISHLIAKHISLKKKVPAIAWYPDVWLNDWFKNAGIYGIFGEMLERVNLARGFNGYIAISNVTAKKIKKFKRNNVHTIYCGVDSAEFNKTAPKSNKITILSVSRLAKYKNIKTLIFAFALLSKKFKNTQLIIVGEGPQKKYLTDLVDNLHQQNKIKFIANLPRKKLIALYKASHLFCLPSSVEGFGIATIEAAAAGVPYVVSDIDVFKEVTKEGQGGFLFKLGDVHDLADKISVLIQKKDLYNKKSKEAISLAQNYEWQKIARETEKVYLSVLK